MQKKTKKKYKISFRVFLFSFLLPLLEFTKSTTTMLFFIARYLQDYPFVWLQWKASQCGWFIKMFYNIIQMFFRNLIEMLRFTSLICIYLLLLYLHTSRYNSIWQNTKPTSLTLEPIPKTTTALYMSCLKLPWTNLII